MKKLIYTLVILFTVSISFAGEIDSILSEARAFGVKKNYSEAIKSYEKFIKLSQNDNLKEVYIEVANCYYKMNKKDIAVKYVKKAITEYGFNEQDFIYNKTIDVDLSNYALAQVYDDLDKMQEKYLASK